MVICQEMLLTMLLSLISYLVQAQNTVYLNTPNPILMYATPDVQPKFAYLENTFCCSYPRIYTLRQSSLTYLNNAPVTINATNVKSISQISLSTLHSTLTPSASAPVCSDSWCAFQIRNNCLSPITEENYFDLLYIKLTFVPLTTPLVFSYFVYCDSAYKSNSFEWSSLLLVSLVLAILLFSSLKSECLSFGGKGVVCTAWLVTAYNGLLLIGGLFTVYLPTATVVIVDVLAWVLGTLSLTLIVMELFYFICFRSILELQIKLKWGSVKAIDGLGFALAMGVMLAWWFTGRNWIISDIISCCLIVAGIKVLKFTSYKVALYAFFFGITVEAALLVAIQLNKNQDYDSYLLNTFNTPFQLQVPSFNPIYNQKCAWLSVSVIAYPGLLIAYLRRFDTSRNTNVYLITSLVTFAVGELLWVVASTFIADQVPFGVLANPIMMIFFFMFAFKRKELRTLWEGRFFDEEFANRSDSVHIEMSRDANLDLFKQDLMKGIEAREDSEGGEACPDK